MWKKNRNVTSFVTYEKVNHIPNKWLGSKNNHLMIEQSAIKPRQPNVISLINQQVKQRPPILEKL